MAKRTRAMSKSEQDPILRAVSKSEQDPMPKLGPLLLQLPTEIINRIVSYLVDSDKAQLARTCQFFGKHFGFAFNSRKSLNLNFWGSIHRYTNVVIDNLLAHAVTPPNSWRYCTQLELSVDQSNFTIPNSVVTFICHSNIGVLNVPDNVKILDASASHISILRGGRGLITANFTLSGSTVLPPEMHKLETLMMRESMINQLPIGLIALHTLDAFESHINDLPDLPAVRKLNVGCTEVSVESLMQVLSDKIEELGIQECDDVAQLPPMPNLVSCDIRHTDITTLWGLPNIKRLCSNYPIEFTAENRANITYFKGSDIRGDLDLRILTNLEELDVGNIGREVAPGFIEIVGTNNISGICVGPGVTKISCEYNYISRIHAINVVILYCSGSHIRRIDMPRLKILQACDIVNLEIVSDGLTHLEVANCRMLKLPMFMPNMITMILNNSDIYKLPVMNNLQELSVSGTQIRCVKSQCRVLECNNTQRMKILTPKLETLMCINSQVDVMMPMPFLQKINISDSRIRGLPAIPRGAALVRNNTIFTYVDDSNDAHFE